MLKILITGDRNYTDLECIKSTFAKITPNLEISESTAIHGDCKGADKLAGYQAEILGFKIQKYPANWKLGKGAGPIRNAEMLKLDPDIVLIFHQNLKESKGTKNCCIQLLKKLTKEYNPIIMLNGDLIGVENLQKLVM